MNSKLNAKNLKKDKITEPSKKFDLKKNIKLEKTRPSINNQSANQSFVKANNNGCATKLDEPQQDLISIKESVSKSRRSASHESSCKSIKMDLNFSELSNHSIRSDQASVADWVEFFKNAEA